MYQKLKLTMRVEQRAQDYALFLNHWVVRSYEKMPSKEELDKQETAALQTIKAYQAMMMDYNRPPIMEVEWVE